MSKINKWVERSARYSWNSSLIDSIIQSVKSLDVLSLKEDARKDIAILNEETNEIDYTSDLASPAQKSYLKQLISLNVIDERERAQWEANIEEMTKEEASNQIKIFKQ